MTNDVFLVLDGVRTEPDALKKAFQGALQHNSTYRDGTGEVRRREFRTAWAKLIREEASRYVRPTQPITDIQHCESILRISKKLSYDFEEILKNSRLRLGTSQKALNLYLKYLWRLGQVARPPHCPLDSIVLAQGGVVGAWTKCDREEQYMEWIGTLRKAAAPLCLAEWEYHAWLQAPSTRARLSLMNH